MKKLILSLSILSLLFTGCSEDDDETITTKTPVEGEISGELTSNKTFVFGNYTLKGIVKVKSGVTVTFDSGSTITATASDGSVDALVVENGGKLIINGTAAEPVVFTEVSKTPGSWGGIIMYGDAPIVGANGVTSAVSEDGLALPYGGSNSAHNGGSLKYVRVEYAGKKITDGTSEMNGFSFYSVGSGTVLENLVSYKGADDGYEFYGGTVSLKNAVSYGNRDDAFDWQDGWRGQDSTNWFAYQTGTGNYGIEVESKNVDNAFWPKVTNITLKRAAGTTTEAQSEIQLDAIQFKKEGNGDYSNIVIDGYKNQTTPTAYSGGAIQILDLNTFNHQVAAGKIKLNNVKITNTDNTFISGAATFTMSETSFLPLTNWSTGAATGASLTGGNWSTTNGVNLLSNL
jgi:hypothetical protein